MSTIVKIVKIPPKEYCYTLMPQEYKEVFNKWLGKSIKVGKIDDKHPRWPCSTDVCWYIEEPALIQDLNNISSFDHQHEDDPFGVCRHMIEAGD